MQFLNDHMGKPRVDGHFHIPSLPQGITVKAMNINLSNETEQFILEIVSVLSIAAVNFFEIKRQFWASLHILPQKININFSTSFQTKFGNEVEKINMTGVWKMRHLI